jgi:hypothetical protein
MKEVLQQAIDFAEYCLEELDLSYMASNQAKRLIEKSKEALANHIPDDTKMVSGVKDSLTTQQEQGSPEDMYIEMHKHLNCPYCCGSGHIEDVKQEYGEPWLLKSTQELAKAMAKEFYPEVTQWKVLDDLAGVISQIDNMATGLIRKPKQEQGEPVAWRVSYPNDPELGFWFAEGIGGEGCLNEPLYMGWADR